MSEKPHLPSGHTCPKVTSLGISSGSQRVRKPLGKPNRNQTPLQNEKPWRNRVGNPAESAAISSRRSALLAPEPQHLGNQLHPPAGPILRRTCTRKRQQPVGKRSFQSAVFERQPQILSPPVLHTGLRSDFRKAKEMTPVAFLPPVFRGSLPMSLLDLQASVTSGLAAPPIATG